MKAPKVPPRGGDDPTQLQAGLRGHQSSSPRRRLRAEVARLIACACMTQHEIDQWLRVAEAEIE